MSFNTLSGDEGLTNNSSATIGSDKSRMKFEMFCCVYALMHRGTENQCRGRYPVVLRWEGNTSFNR